MMLPNIYKTQSVLNLESLNNQPLRERIAEILRTAIITGKLKPNTALVETDVARQLCVSRAPVREAFQILNKEGLLETTPYRGTVVKVLTREDIEEIYTLRSALESFAIRRILEGNRDISVTRLNMIYQKMLHAARDQNHQALNIEDAHFHRTLIELANHHLLLEHWNMLFVRIQQVLSLRNLQNDNLAQIASNHLPILESLRERDVERAEQVIRTHIESAGDLVTAGWEAEMVTCIENL